MSATKPAALALETSGKRASAALLLGGGLFTEISYDDEKTHSEKLMPLIDCLFKKAGAKPSDLDYIACTAGPGSFTGIRIGAATAKGLAFGLGLSIIPVPTLDALAYNVSYMECNRVAAIMDARRGQVYAACYSIENGRLIRIAGYSAESLDDFLAKLGEPCVFVGDAVCIHKDAILAGGHKIAPDENLLQNAASVARLAENYEPVAAADFKLIYLRQSQAEREFGKNG